jgi:hypothetical protein
LLWFKSSRSEASGNACVEVARHPGHLVGIRDSVFPDRAITATRPAFDALVTHARQETRTAVSSS